MVVTIEPGAYVPGKWGVRIEDVVVVTCFGLRSAGPHDKELVISLASNLCWEAARVCGDRTADSAS